MENLVVCNSIFVGHPFHEIRSAAVQAHLVVHEATDYTGDIISPIIEDIRQLRDDVWELHDRTWQGPSLYSFDQNRSAGTKISA